VVRSLAEHPLPALLAAGVTCTVNTDDPAMFGTDLGTEHATARSLGATPYGSYAAGLAGALCDSRALAGLRRIGDEFDWAGGDSASSMQR
jgi:aminodeoxyfutalosine deaminase